MLVGEGSANRDDSAFDGAGQFDIRRNPNPHLGFGSGTHFCLGANLARLEIRLLLDEILSRFGELEQAPPAEWNRSNRHTGLRRARYEADARTGRCLMPVDEARSQPCTSPSSSMERVRSRTPRTAAVISEPREMRAEAEVRSPAAERRHGGWGSA